jgi:DNA-binding IclR family transcriptional regulator
MKTVRSVERAISILNYVAESQASLGLSEISRSVGLDKATTLRLITTLEQAGLIRQEARTRRYILGPNISRLINTLHTDIRQTCRPHMEQLVRATGETVCLNVRRGLERVVAEAVDAEYELCVSPAIGSAVPIYVGASGKCFLAHLPEEEVDEIIKITKLQPRTKASITDPERLKRQLKLIRRQGYAVSQGETLAGGASVAAPVFDRAGRIAAAVDLRGPQLRLDRMKLNQLAPLVMRCAAAISRDLGFEVELAQAE